MKYEIIKLIAKIIIFLSFSGGLIIDGLNNYWFRDDFDGYRRELEDILVIVYLGYAVVFIVSLILIDILDGYAPLSYCLLLMVLQYEYLPFIAKEVYNNYKTGDKYK